MHPTILRSALAGLACAMAAVLAWPTQAEVMNLQAAMNANSEVPPNASKGTLTATYDTSSKKLSWKGSYSGLTGPVTAAHFHSGEPGKNGGVAVPITPNTHRCSSG
jgi:CHRD domain